jgi:parvulin-like peptidyl-prolyl isomerase
MRRLFLFILFSFLFAISAFSQSGLQTVAVVNLIRSEPITVNQLRTEVQKIEASEGRTSTVAERRQVLDVMINQRLILQAAERDRITVTENELNQYFQNLRSQMAQSIGRQPTDAEFAQEIKSQLGMEVAAYREEVRKQGILEKYIMDKKGDLINSVKMPTEQEIVSEYNIYKSQLVRPDTVRFSMIRVLYGSDAASRTRARELGDRLIREIGSNPSKFDEVSARSVIPNSGYQAADAGYIPRNLEARNTIGQNLMDAAFSLRQGQVSSLIEGIEGFYIIKVTENYAQKNLELDDVIQLGTNVTVRNYISQGLYEQRQMSAFTKASEDLIAELRNGRSFQVFENYLNW